VSREVSKFGSDTWIPHLKTLCFDFAKKMQKYPGGRFLRFRDEIGEINKPGRIVKEYHRTAAMLKLHIFGDNAENELIDYHKIGALYIRSFLKFKPFYLDIPKETKNPELSMYAVSANEYFAIVYLSALFKGWDKNNDGVLRMDEAYKKSFIMQLHQYSKNIKTLDPTSFSTIIYFIEKTYFVHNDLVGR